MQSPSCVPSIVQSITYSADASPTVPDADKMQLEPAPWSVAFHLTGSGATGQSRLRKHRAAITRTTTTWASSSFWGKASARNASAGHASPSGDAPAQSQAPVPARHAPGVPRRASARHATYAHGPSARVHGYALRDAATVWNASIWHAPSSWGKLPFNSSTRQDARRHDYVLIDDHLAGASLPKTCLSGIRMTGAYLA